jgi:hypothetical protein
MKFVVLTVVWIFSSVVCAQNSVSVSSGADIEVSPKKEMPQVKSPVADSLKVDAKGIQDKLNSSLKKTNSNQNESLDNKNQDVKKGRNQVGTPFVNEKPKLDMPGIDKPEIEKRDNSVEDLGTQKGSVAGEKLEPKQVKQPSGQKSVVAGEKESAKDLKEEKNRKIQKIKNKSKYCKKYNRKYIAYYSDVFQVRKCKRIPISSYDLARLTVKGAKVIPVKGEVVNSIPLIGKDELAKAKIRKCSKFEGAYITLDNDTIFIVEKCKKRKFPDWASFNSHRYKKGIRSIKLHKVSWEELQSIKDGSEIASVLDSRDEFKIGEEVDTIPLKEACKGLEGKYVSYYSRVYKIYKCHKRPVDPVKYTRKVRKKPKELSSEQWLSLPVGAPYNL